MSSLEGSAQLRVEVAEVVLEEPAGSREWVPLRDYHQAEPDPLCLGAAEQLQHLAARHPDAVATLSRLCDRVSLTGATRVLPIALDRYGVVLRIERLRDHRDVRLPFRHRIDTGAEAAIEMRHLLTEGGRRRPCARPTSHP
jgi:hypothetical protein